MKVPNFLASIQGTTHGLVFLLKTEYDVHSGNLSESTLADFHQELSAALDAAVAPSLAIIDDVLLSCNPQFNLCGAGVPDVSDGLVRLMQVNEFFHFNIDTDRLGLDDDDLDDDDFLWTYHDLVDLKPYYHNTLRGKQSFFWAMPTSDFEATVGSSSRPDELRNRCGLDHFGKGTYILGVHVPPAVASSLASKSPTILDGGTKLVFLPARMADGFGRALHLLSLTAGAREAVVEELTFDTRSEVEKIGRTETAPPADRVEAILSLCESRRKD